MQNLWISLDETSVQTRPYRTTKSNMASWRKPFGKRDVDQRVTADQGAEVSDGTLRYVAVGHAGNDSGPTYQEATGAPVEVDSPLGYDVGPVTIIFLNVSMMIGTGVYSTRKPIPHLSGPLKVLGLTDV